MRERTFITAMFGLDLMLILAAAVMAWSHAIPPRTAHPGASSGAGVVLMNAVIAMVLIAGVGGYCMYELNVAVFGIAESPTRHRTAFWVAGLFVAATFTGGLIGLIA